MVATHDELFCRLAIRQGILNRETGVEILTRFRSERRHGEGIADFVVAEGYVEAHVADKLEGAISKRASGHVSERAPITAKRTKKGRLNKVAAGKTGGRGHHPALHHHRHHAPAHAKTVSNTPMHAVAIGLGAIIAIGAVIYLVVQMQGESPVELMEQKRKEAEARKEAAAAAAAAEKTGFETQQGKEEKSQKRQYTAKEIEKYTDQADQEIAHARMMQGDPNTGPYRALQYLLKQRDSNGGKMLPISVLSMYDREEKDFLEQLEFDYADLLVELEEAHANGGDTASILADIGHRCGPDFRTKAEKAIE